ncbi:class I SAM-dependent methyltransferase [Prochlorococcus sp. MIT 1307]|uniref:class I SAM-dependent methyltransferase n=1 Tax=Prochlorococcus sp. MIT 1307 TaxID=3096219 RepID=UPI002A7602FB|nr:methyltransferase domain-containing protein [Prochlorococcus sp. MIT 1307]
MIDYNRVAHSSLLNLAVNIDTVVAKGTNFKDFSSVKNFLSDVINNRQLRGYLESQYGHNHKFNIVDLCSGSGIFGIALASLLGRSGTIHFIDIVGEYHETATRLTKSILGDSYQAVTHTCSADQTSLEDNSIDIAIEVNGFHHCPSLSKVITETKRVLRPNGILLGLDRIHDSNVSDRQLNLLLDAEYSSQWLKENNYIDQKLTRRQNGEGEIRFCEWEKSLINCGFKYPFLIQYVSRSKRSYKVWLISNLPEKISRIFLKFWVKPPRWSFRMLMTMVFGISMTIQAKESKIITRKFPKYVNATIVRMEVIICKT